MRVEFGHREWADIDLPEGMQGRGECMHHGGLHDLGVRHRDGKSGPRARLIEPLTDAGSHRCKRLSTVWRRGRIRHPTSDRVRVAGMNFAER